MAEELNIRNVIRVLKNPRDPQKPWMSSTGIAKRILGQEPTEQETNEVQKIRFD